MTEITTPSTIPHTRYAVTIRYESVEDRLLVYCGDNSGHLGLLQLTRRITGSLLQGMVRLLSNGGPTLLRVPTEMQQEVLHFEHQSALSKAEINQNRKHSIPSKPPHIVFLVNTVNIRETPERAYVVGWIGTRNQTITMTMSRLDLHCLTHVLQQHAQACGWDLPALPRWMQAGDGQSGQPAILS
jgi:hypothetical protein